MFKVGITDTLNKQIYELGNGQWNISKLRQLLEEILPHNTTLRDFPVQHEFPNIGPRTMMLNAHRLLLDGDPTPMILLGIEDNGGQRPPA
jgi:hypothetical protein